MTEYIRNQYGILRERIGEPRKFIQVLAGPRQVGKSTLVGQVLNDVTIPYMLENADGVNAERTEVENVQPHSFDREIHFLITLSHEFFQCISS